MFLYQTNALLKIIDFSLIKQLNDLNTFMNVLPRDGMVIQMIKVFRHIKEYSY